MGVDNTHGGSFYLADSTGSAIKDLTFELPLSDISKMYFSKNILFRFKDDTTLEVMTNLTGDINTSNVEVKDITLLMKKRFLTERETIGRCHVLSVQIYRRVMTSALLRFCSRCQTVLLASRHEIT